MIGIALAVLGAAIIIGIAINAVGGILANLLDGIRTEVGTLRTAINSLAERLSDNPTAEEAAAVGGELRGLSTSLDSLDPDVSGGVVTPETVPSDGGDGWA